MTLYPHAIGYSGQNTRQNPLTEACGCLGISPWKCYISIIVELSYWRALKTGRIRHGEIRRKLEGGAIGQSQWQAENRRRGNPTGAVMRQLSASNKALDQVADILGLKADRGSFVTVKTMDGWTDEELKAEQIKLEAEIAKFEIH